METSISTQMAQTNLMNQVGTAVLAKSLQDLKQSGSDVVSLMQTAATVQDPALGQHVNTSA